MGWTVRGRKTHLRTLQSDVPVQNTMAKHDLLHVTLYNYPAKRWSDPAFSHDRFVGNGERLLLPWKVILTKTHVKDIIFGMGKKGMKILRNQKIITNDVKIT